MTEDEARYKKVYLLEVIPESELLTWQLIDALVESALRDADNQAKHFEALAQHLATFAWIKQVSVAIYLDNFADGLGVRLMLRVSALELASDSVESA